MEAHESDEESGILEWSQLLDTVPALPRRGDKDFEPDGTQRQDGQLQDSFHAMVTVLSRPRVAGAQHTPHCVWRAEDGMAYVAQPRGIHFKSMGIPERGGTGVFLWPEETLYLLERGSLVCTSPNGLPMSLQEAYATLLPYCRSLDHLQTYSYLRRAGWRVLRHKPTAHADAASYQQQSLWQALTRALARPRYPLQLCRGVYTYANAFERLRLIPVFEGRDTNSRLCIDFDLWKPGTNFKKSDPGPPDHYVAVCSAQDGDMPSLHDLDALVRSVPLQGRASAQLPRLKTGCRGVVLAVVDSGITSFTRIGDVRFAEEPLKGR